VSKKTGMLILAVLAPVVLGLCIWTLIVCLEFLQSPPGGGGASIGPDGKLVISPPPVKPIKTLIASAITLPLCVVWGVFFVLWMRAKDSTPDEEIEEQPCPRRKR
jgi:hypothetical protein